MYAVVYRWRVRAGMEDQFVRSWERVTRAILAACGSYGSRLHRCSDGTWIGYARWPDAAARESCEHAESEAGRLMLESVEEAFPPVFAEIVADLLREPSA